MSDQLLPDFDDPGSQPHAVRPGPKKPRRKPAKKKAVRAPSLKVAKRVPKKRRVRKTFSKAKAIVAEVPMTPSEAQAGWDVLYILAKQPRPAAVRIIDEVKALYK